MNWIVGDVHGKVKALESLLKNVNKKDPEAKLHFAGDYVDRGENSKEVVNILLELKNTTFIRGNHDDIFDLVCNGSSNYYFGTDADDPNLDIIQAVWLCNFGLIDTLMSYGVKLHAIMELAHKSNNEQFDLAREVLDGIRQYIPEGHKKFFKNLPLSNEQPDFFVIHAYINVNAWGNQTINEWINANKSAQNEALWSRFNNIQLFTDKKWQKNGYFGHTVTNYYQDGDLLPIEGKKLTLIDTGSFVQNGRLTAYCHEQNDYMQFDENGSRVT